MAVTKLDCWCGCQKYFDIGCKSGRLIVECFGCGTWYVKEIPKNYYDMYSSGKYQREIQKTIGCEPYPDRYDHDFNVATIRLAELSQFEASGHLLDIGCGNGAFVDAANRSCNYVAYGVDIDPLIELHGDMFLSLNIETTDLPDGWNSFDVITLYDTLEHFIDPIRSLDYIIGLLNSKGLLVIAAPDFSSNEAIKQGLDWKHVRPEQHIYMIKPNFIIEILDRLGMRIEARLEPIPNQYAIYARKI